MNHRKILLVLLGVSVILLGIGVSFLYPVETGVCSSGDRECIYSNGFTYGEPITFGFIPFVLTLVILLFFSSEVFNVWKWFGIIIVPLGIISIFLVPVTCSGLYCFDKESLSWFIGIGFLIVSIIIATYKTIKK